MCRSGAYVQYCDAAQALAPKEPVVDFVPRRANSAKEVVAKAVQMTGNQIRGVFNVRKREHDELASDRAQFAHEFDRGRNVLDHMGADHDVPLSPGLEGIGVEVFNMWVLCNRVVPKGRINVCTGHPELHL